ncbi:MAG TPA: hypothetical protein VK741_23695 [Acetobacteraceae bacterium]|nr:hypothetical protein [Acetobacteraceae bacterium]
MEDEELRRIAEQINTKLDAILDKLSSVRADNHELSLVYRRMAERLRELGDVAGARLLEQWARQREQRDD